VLPYKEANLMHSEGFALESSNRVGATHTPEEIVRRAVRAQKRCHQNPGRRRRGGSQRGFTLVEVLIVVVILMTISAIAIPSMMAAMDAARVARAAGDIEAIEDAITLYEVIYGQLPDDLAQVGYGGLLDPWGNPYEYLNHTTMKGNGQARKDRFLVPLNDDYDLYSAGKDGASLPPITAKPSQDDILRASSGSYVGLASQY
jgi:general secretion pathway protein G